MINILKKTFNYLKWYSFKKTIHLLQTKIRKCKCCNKLSLIISLDKGEETKRCIFCLANLRYEMIAEYIRNHHKQLNTYSVLELDFNSPIKSLLQKSNEYIQSYYSDTDTLGKTKNGVQCEDITNLTFKDNKFDLIISSDVLEHVCDLNLAFNESARVLKPNGIHIFTVPVNNNSKTFKRCDYEKGHLKHFVDPEYHYDPLNKNGCLVYWTFGTDIGEYFESKNYTISILKGPIGTDKRYLFALTKK